MDIHKPKAAHSIREFLIEIGTIICGILIALALEQAVEALRVQREVAETRAAIHAEIATNATLAKLSLAEFGCSAGEKARLLAWANGGAKPGGAMVWQLPILSSTVWDTARLNGVAQMPLKEQLNLAKYYESVKKFNDNQDLVKQLWVRIYGELALDKLSSDRADQFKEDVTSGTLMISVQVFNAPFVIESASALKIDPAPVEKWRSDYLKVYCRSLGAPSPPLG
jgi:hypothetical protein